MELDAPVTEMAHLKSFNSAPTPLDAPVGEAHQSVTLGEIIGDEKGESPHESLCKQN
jgi:DNA-directed RNA polymerase sigma subunit (sigma70/sigma32)